ncbi:MAG TPA: fibro-slime domain-containing protein, partial [Polyangia bacterium]|nr:fibro-slime domain-containing protein [Polyangia bacterium]
TGAGCSNTAAQGTVGVYLPDSIALSMLIRDFKKYNASDPTTNPAFHNTQVRNSELDVVAGTLGTDGKPVYKIPANNVPTFGTKYFDQWYHDVPGTNIAVSYPITLTTSSDGLLTYDCHQTGTPDMATGTPRLLFFPIDDGSSAMTAFGDEGDVHNFAFTGELHALFTYAGQGVFKFRSDDDLYVFIGGNLIAAASAPGQHVAEAKMLDLTALTLTVGHEYPLDLFYAERAGAAGDFMMATSVVLRAAQ